MKVEHVILADAAQVADGKLYLLGGIFGIARCLSFPTYPQMAFAVSVLFDREDGVGPHNVTVNFTDDSGTPVLPPATLQLGVGAPEAPGFDARGMFALNAQVPIQRAGRYTLT